MFSVLFFFFFFFFFLFFFFLFFLFLFLFFFSAPKVLTPLSTCRPNFPFLCFSRIAPPL